MLKEKDLISEIITNREFRWDFAFKNKPIPRPFGETVFMVSQEVYPNTFSRISILKLREEINIIGQVQVKWYDGKYVLDLRGFLDSKDNRIWGTIDLDSRFYNIEWHFRVPYSFWLSMIDKVKDLYIPVFPSGLSDNCVRTMWIKNFHDYHTFRLIGEDEKYNEIKDVMNYLLNYSLDKVDTAYWINKIPNTI